MFRYATTPPDQDPIKFDVTGKDVKDKKGVLSLVGFMMDSTMPYQISITDLKQFNEYHNEEPKQEKLVSQKR